MATVVERPFTVMNDVQPTSQERRQESVEIIDVDLIDELNDHRSQLNPIPRPAYRHRLTVPETIDLVDSDSDSDSDSEIRQLHISSAGIPQAPRRRLFSPPPRNQVPVVVVPPVPQLPRHLYGQRSFPMSPMRRRPPFHPTSAPVIRPNDQPFPFEAEIHPRNPTAGPSNRNQPHTARNPLLNYPALAAAPPSHHIPNMGLGGALIAHNRGPPPQPHRRMQDWRLRTNRVLLALGGAFLSQNPETDGDEMLAIRMMIQEAEADNELNMMRLDRHAVMQRRTAEKFKEHGNTSHYNPSYTHPKQPESGFTFDFAPPASPPHDKPPTPHPSKFEPIVIDDDEEENGIAESSSLIQPPSPALKLSTVLVCARCLDPLVLSGGLTSEAIKQKRVWGLRCGHLIDGKCLAEIGQPQEVAFLTDVKGKGKGKARAMDPPQYGHSPQIQAEAEEEHDSAFIPAETNIRSRLRSRLHAVSDSPIVTSASRPPAKKRRTSQKGRRVEAEHQWMCPVNGCGRNHVSVKVDGVWGPEPDQTQAKKQGASSSMPTNTPGMRSAIPIFV